MHRANHFIFAVITASLGVLSFSASGAELFQSTPAATPSAGMVRIDAQDGKTHTAYISQIDVNRLITPFENPVFDTLSDAQIDQVGNALLITPASSFPISGYLRSSDGKGPVFQVVLKPSNLPVGQQIQLHSAIGPSPTGSDSTVPASDVYETRLVETLRSIARSETPKGYAMFNGWTAKSFTLGPLKAEPLQAYQSANFALWQYTIKNTATTPIELSEPNFYFEGVKAVAFYPRVLLAPNEDTVVHMIVDRSKQQ